MMNIVRLHGGLANQMFQYAFGQALGADTLYDLSRFDRIKRGKTVRTFCLDVFNIPNLQAFQKIPRKGNWFLKFFVPSKYQHKIKESYWCGFDAGLLDKKSGTNYFKGYFQNECYLDCVKDVITEQFTLENPVAWDNLQLLNEIQNYNSVSMHVRRSDYLKRPDRYPVCEQEYYNQAMQIIENRIDSPHYFLFSDDPEWCKANLKTDKTMTIVDINSGENGYLDMELMKNCKHNIIANSSFSWMAAYLNQNPDKIVIAPKEWQKKNGKLVSNLGLSDKYIQI